MLFFQLNNQDKMSISPRKCRMKLVEWDGIFYKNMIIRKKRCILCIVRKTPWIGFLEWILVRFGILELRNRVTQNDLSLWVANSKSKNKKFHFELLTQRFNFYFSTFELLTWRLDFYFFTFELLTRGWKIKSYTSSY